MIAIGPGEPAQLIHRDQWAFDFFPFPTGYEVQCNTIWAMTDFTDENGATRVIPGSHRYEDKLEFDARRREAGRDAGGLGALLHRRALPRRRREPLARRRATGSTSPTRVSWLRQEENQYLSVPLEVARDAARRRCCA